MFLDFSWVAEPTAWGGLGTLILLEVVLGIDNLVFISILSSRLPEDKRRHCCIPAKTPCLTPVDHLH